MTASKKRPARTKPGAAKPKAFFSKDSYHSMMSGLKEQGIERDEAIETLKVGLREANGLAVPLDLKRTD